MEASTFALPVTTDGTRHMEDSWAIHELANTTDFALRSSTLYSLVCAMYITKRSRLLSV